MILDGSIGAMLKPCCRLGLSIAPLQQWYETISWRHNYIVRATLASHPVQFCLPDAVLLSIEL